MNRRDFIKATPLLTAPALLPLTALQEVANPVEEKPSLSKVFEKPKANHVEKPKTEHTIEIEVDEWSARYLKGHKLYLKNVQLNRTYDFSISRDRDFSSPMSAVFLECILEGLLIPKENK